MPSGTGQAIQQLIGQVGQRQSGFAKFLKLEGAFKQARMIAKRDELNAARERAFTAQENQLDRQSRENIAAGRIGQQQQLLQTIQGGGIGQPVQQETGDQGLINPQTEGDVFLESATVNGVKLNSRKGILEAAKLRAQGGQLVPKVSDTQKQSLNEVRLQRTELTRLKGLAESVTQSGPVRGRAGSVLATVVGGEFFNTEALKRYNDQIPTEAVAIYRAISGDKRINNEDARDRALPLLWQPALGEGPKLRSSKFRDLQKMLVARERLIRKGVYVVDLESGSLITPIGAVREEAGLDPVTELSPVQGGSTITLPSGKVISITGE